MKTEWIEQFFYRRSIIAYILCPVAYLFQLITTIRRLFLVRFKQKKLPVPVIIVGNLSLGGVGKTPLVISLINACLKKGLRPGIISRGYKARIKTLPHLINPSQDTALDVGDEPLFIAQKTLCPVVIAPNRVEAAETLLKHHKVDLIISDDGLQHYRLSRSLEIIVIDGLRGFGNGFCCPIGPLRETPSRLKKADFIVINGEPTHHSLAKIKQNYYPMHLNPTTIKELKSKKEVSVIEIPKPIAAVTGIGHPRRFFNTLDGLALIYEPYAFPDHYQFTPKDFHFKEKSVIMTEKDAVKCTNFAKEPWYFLAVEATLSETFWNHFWLVLKEL